MNKQIRNQIEDAYVVTDNETGAVLCGCKSISSAHAVSIGFLNCNVHVLLTSLPLKLQSLDFDYNDQEISYQVFSGRANVLPPILNTEEWKNKRRLALIRNQMQFAWERVCKKYVEELIGDYFGAQFFEPFILKAVADSDYGRYAQPIVEWAQLSGISNEAAFKELKMRSEFVGMAYVRNHAIYHKHVYKINQEKERESMLQALTDGTDDLFLKAAL